MSKVARMKEWRPGLRAGVLTVCALLILGTAVAVSTTVSDHLASTAVGEATRQASAVVRGFVDPMFPGGNITAATPGQAAAINAQLERLAGAGSILRIKVWSLDGTVAYSDLPALRGRNFGVAGDLQEVFEGATSTEFSAGDAAENVFERGLANRFLSIYLPIRTSQNVEPIGAYEIYEDAAPIETEIAATRETVLLIVGTLAIILLVLLFSAFSGASRLLARRNRLLHRSQSRFRSLVQNSADVNMIVDPQGTITYESPAVEQVLGYRPEERVGASAFATVVRGDRGPATQSLADVVRTPGGQTTTEVRVKHADGTVRNIEMVLKNLLDDPAVEGVVVNYRDVTQRRALEDELRHQAFHDALTGLANRALFLDRLQHAMSRKRGFGRPLAVLFVDLDDFKTVNDSLATAKATSSWWESPHD